MMKSTNTEEMKEETQEELQEHQIATTEEEPEVTPWKEKDTSEKLQTGAGLLGSSKIKED